jgi:hypothetical protein
MRQHMTSLLGYDEATEAKLRQMYADPGGVGLGDSLSQLTAYASQPVPDATRAVEAAHIEVKAKVEDFTALRKRADSPGPGRADDAEVPAAWRESEAALIAAKLADDALEARIRADLARRPSKLSLQDELATGRHTALPPSG